MKNKFKFQNRIFQIACEGKSCCVINGVPCACEDSDCEMCDFNNTFECNSQFKAWCNTEEDEVKKTDWSKVKKDEKVYARDKFGYWIPSHFACFDGDYVYVYVNGKSSFTEYITRKYLPNDVVLASRKDNKNEKSDN